MKKYMFSTAILASLLGAVLPGGPGFAADFEHRSALDRSSRQSGLGRHTVPLLERQAGPGMKAAADLLTKRFQQPRGAITTRGPVTVEVQADRMRMSGEGWSLQVRQDGTRALYRNHAYLDSARNRPRPVGERLTNAQLEVLGRRFVTTVLTDFIVLGKGEALVPFSTTYQVDGVQAHDSRVPQETVAANIVTFSRTVGGVEVVGPGSKVTVIFGTDGTPAGFSFDWPRYESSGRTQSLLSLDDLYDRELELSVLNRDNGQTDLERMECGYFDAGAGRREDGAPVQAACVFHYVQTTIGDAARNARNPDDGLMHMGLVTPIPAGATLEPDCRWPQVQSLLGGDMCTGKGALP